MDTTSNSTLLLIQGRGGTACRVLPYVIDLVGPESILDVGCGLRHWVSVASEAGVTRTVGVDEEWACEHLAIPAECFVEGDIRRGVPLEEPFDLAMSVEVAEHLPEA